MPHDPSMWAGRGPVITVEELSRLVGQTLTTHQFSISLESLERYRECVHDYLAYPADENPDYPVGQVNLCYLLALVDTLRVQLFVDDPRFLVLTTSVGEARISRPLMVGDPVVMQCLVESVRFHKGKVWCEYGYNFTKTGESSPFASSKQTICLVPREC